VLGSDLFNLFSSVGESRWSIYFCIGGAFNEMRAFDCGLIPHFSAVCILLATSWLHVCDIYGLDF